jgi:hypothetical protein
VETTHIRSGQSIFYRPPPACPERQRLLVISRLLYGTVQVILAPKMHLHRECVERAPVIFQFSTCVLASYTFHRVNNITILYPVFAPHPLLCCVSYALSVRQGRGLGVDLHLEVPKVRRSCGIEGTGNLKRISWLWYVILLGNRPRN